MSKLAILGGDPLRTKPFPIYHSIGDEEKKAVMEAMDGKVLSAFLGTWSENFYGGPRVRALEKAWAEYFGVKHAISVNSATSGLYAAVGASGISPGDEVIVAPYTMIASATAALVYGGIPVFADIDEDIFCITPMSIRERITPYTRAIIVVDLFGHPADLGEIMNIARENNLLVIEDAAQAPGAKYHGRNAGTLADIGVFSLNYHKTIHSGEGGMVVTDDDELAERVRLIRNHAEVVVGNKGTRNLINMVGFNYRMTEIEASIANSQLKKLENLILPRIKAADYLTEHLGEFKGIQTPLVRDGIRHGYYLYVIRFDEADLDLPRDRFVEALNAEGIPMVSGYVKPIYLEPMYQKRIAFGKDGYPFTYPGYKGQINYDLGICPVTERMYFEELMFTNVCHAGIQLQDLRDFVDGFQKVYENISDLRAI